MAFLSLTKIYNMNIPYAHFSCSCHVRSMAVCSDVLQSKNTDLWVVTWMNQRMGQTPHTARSAGPLKIGRAHV